MRAFNSPTGKCTSQTRPDLRSIPWEPAESPPTRCVALTSLFLWVSLVPMRQFFYSPARPSSCIVPE